MRSRLCALPLYFSIVRPLFHTHTLTNGLMNDLELILVHNHKGGTGKTMLAVHLALHMASKGQPWVLWDTDAQCNAMSWLTRHEWQGEADVFVPGNGQGVDLMATTDLDLAEDKSHVIVDTPPAESILDFIGQHMQLNAQDMIVCPVNGRLSIDGAIKVAEETAPSGCRVVLVPNLTDPYDSHAREEIAAIRELSNVTEINVEVFQMAIPRNDTYMREAELQGVPIWELPHARRTHTAKALFAFCDWVAKGAPPEANRPEAHRDGNSPYNVSRKLKNRLWT